jgi:allantoinase
MQSPPRRFALVSNRVVTADGLRPAALLIEGQTISAVVGKDELVANVPVEDVGDSVIAPGIIDSHVHINEPGRTEWEGFESGTRAAAAGGVTTLIDMPLNCDPVTTSVRALEAKRSAADGKCWVDVGFYGGLAGGNVADIPPLLDAGVCGIKCFLCHSGLDDFPAATETELRAVLPILSHRGVPLLVHAELIHGETASVSFARNHRDWAAMRPKRFEVAAVKWMRDLSAEYRAPVHIVHLSSAEGAALVADAQRAGTPLGAETCPHYLHFCADEIAPADPRFKCAPAIGDRHDRDVLWQALVEGTIRTIGSDHSPCPPALKYLTESDYLRAWGGISSLQLTLPVVWTGARQHNVPIERLSDWLSAAPARLVGIADRKGRIAAGFDADLVVWNPEAQWRIDASHLQHRHKLTPYDGESVWGRVQRTYVRGQIVFDEGARQNTPRGRLVCRTNHSN